MHGPSADVRLRVEPRVVLAVLLTVDLLLVLLHVVSRWLAFNGERVLRRSFDGHELLDLDAEVSIPTWWQQLLVFGAAALALLLGHLVRRGSGRWARHWTALGAILVLVSIDEGAEIHERLIHPMRSMFGVTGGIFWFAWLIPGLVALVVFGVTFARFWAQLPARPRALTGGGGALYLLGAVVLEMVGGAYESSVGEQDLGYTMVIAVEEGLELLGMTVFVVGLLSMLAVVLGDRRVSVSVGP